MQDGVDVLSLSLGLSLNVIILEDDAIAVATFAAVEKGVLVVASAGNDGPLYWTLINGAPWLLTVGAGTIDREFEGSLINFKSLYPGNSSPSHVPLVFMDACDSVTALKEVINNIVVCGEDSSISSQIDNAVAAGVLGAVFISNSALLEVYIRSSFPAAFINVNDGVTIIDYIKICNNPKGSLQFRKTVIGTKPAPMVDSYSSRGPFLSCPNILKPDLLAPGTLVLASWSPISSVAKVQSGLLYGNFNLMSGTFMATPHVTVAKVQSGLLCDSYC